jgi:hypothetical protein
MTRASKETQRALAEETAARLGALREELRLKVHLAGMDARDEWEEELRPRLQDLEERLAKALRRGAGEARVQAHLGLMELREAWTTTLEPRLRDLVGRLQARDGRKLHELLRGAREAFDRAAEEEPNTPDAGAPQ